MNEVFHSQIQHPKMWGRKRKVTILLLGLLTAIVPFSVDMYLPGFPDIARSLNTTINKVAFSLTSFFIGVGLGQLLYGPLLDRFGRKRPLYAGLALYVLASVACAYAPSITFLITFRFLQAIGACSGTIAATALVRDLFPPEENARIFSFLILILSVSPLLAPTMGGYMGAAWGWTSIFFFLAVLIGVLLLGSICYLPAGNKGDKQTSLHPVAIGRRYVAILKVPQFTSYALIGSLAFSSLFTYIASSPGVFISYFQLTPKNYGLLFAFLASGLTIASQVSTWLLKRFHSQQIIGAVLRVQNGIAFMLLLCTLLHLTTFWNVVILLFLYLACLGLLIPNASALAMRPFTTDAGSASALLGFFQMGLGSLATLLVGTLHIQTILPMTLCLTATTFIGTGLAAWTRRRHKKGDQPASAVQRNRHGTMAH